MTHVLENSVLVDFLPEADRGTLSIAVRSAYPEDYVSKSFISGVVAACNIAVDNVFREKNWGDYSLEGITAVGKVGRTLMDGSSAIGVLTLRPIPPNVDDVADFIRSQVETIDFVPEREIPIA